LSTSRRSSPPEAQLLSYTSTWAAGISSTYTVTPVRNIELHPHIIAIHREAQLLKHLHLYLKGNWFWVKVKTDMKHTIIFSVYIPSISAIQQLYCS
jgi:hypothetical protein